MPINKVYSIDEAVKDIPDGASIMIGNWGTPGDNPQNLILALCKQGARNLTLICSNGGMSDVTEYVKGQKYVDPHVLSKNNQVRKIICSVPFGIRPGVESITYKKYVAGELEIEHIPQGTLAERIRAGGFGIGGFYTRTGVGTVVEKGKEKRVIDGKEYLLESPLKADYALVRAYKADRYGNLVYRRAMRTFGPLVATAARVTIAEVDEIVELGELDPDAIVTPAVFVDRVVETKGELIVN